MVRARTCRSLNIFGRPYGAPTQVLSPRRFYAYAEQAFDIRSPNQQFRSSGRAFPRNA